MSEYSLPPFYEFGNHELVLGHSFSPHNIAKRPIKNAIISDTSSRNEVAGGRYFYSYNFLEEESKLTWDSQMSIRVSARTLGMKAKAAFSKKDRLETTSRIFTIAVSAEATFGDEYTSNERLSESAKDIVDAGKHLSPNVFGTHYVYRVTKGARITAFLTFHDVSRSVVRKLNSSVGFSGKAGAFGGSLSASFSEILEEMVRRSSLSIEVATVGTRPPADLVIALTAAAQDKKPNEFYERLGKTLDTMKADSAEPLEFYHRSISEIDERTRFPDSWADEDEEYLRWLWETYAKIEIDKELISQIANDDRPFAQLLSDNYYPSAMYREPWSRDNQERLTTSETLDEMNRYQDNIRDLHGIVLTDAARGKMAKPEKRYYISFARNLADADPFFHEAVENIVGTPGLTFECHINLEDGSRRNISGLDIQLLLSSRREKRIDVLRRLFGSVSSYFISLRYFGEKTPIIRTKWRWSDGDLGELQEEFGAPSRTLFSSWSDGVLDGGLEASRLEQLVKKKGTWSYSESKVFLDAGGREFEIEWFSGEFTSNGRSYSSGKYILADREILAECLV